MREMQVFGVERLEDRLLMAVNITQNGVNLFIEGDAAGDRILVQGSGEGDVAVYVDENANGLFEADELYGEYSGVKHVRVSLGDGDDYMVVQYLDIDGHLTVNGGDGEEDVTIAGFSHIGGNVSVDTGDDYDRVVIGVADIDGKLTIDTGGGNDLVVLSDQLDVDGKTLIVTGAGDDFVEVQAENTDTELGDLAISTGGGDDRIEFYVDSADITIEGRTDINLGSGDDYLGIFEGVGGGSVNFIGNFSADGGAGDDEFDIDAFFGGKSTVKDF